MVMREIESIVREHPFFQDTSENDIKIISECGKNVFFDSGIMIARERDPADWFYLIRHGKIAIETTLPQHGSVILQTLSDGDILGWSWLFPPYLWTFDVRTIEPTRAIALNGACLRTKCDQDFRMGYFLMKKFAQIMTDRLQSTRIRLLDIYEAIPKKDLSA